MLAFLLLSIATTPPTGVWRGESICTTAASACTNEKVIYYIDPVPNRSDMVQIRADKIVDGKAVTMGTSQWQYDSEKGTLTWETAGRVWRLAVNGNRIDGTLTVPPATLFRRVRLQKD
jgi:hypothetical protein